MGRRLNGEGAGIIPLMTISEAAMQHGVSRNKVADYIKSGKVLGYSVKGHIYITAESIEDYKYAYTWDRRGPNFTAVVNGHSEGKSDYAISRELGLTRERVRQIRSKVGLPVNPRRPTLPKKGIGEHND